MNEELSNYCSQTFVVLDKWLNQIGAEKGEEALHIVQKTIQNNLTANLTYYESLAKDAAENGHDELASRYRLLAKLYRGLLE